MKRTIIAVWASVLFSCGLSFSAGENDAVLNVMADEIKKSYEVLSKIDDAPLYYMAYEITGIKKYSLSARFGGIYTDEDKNDRYIDVDVRVGSPQLDNTHQFKGGSYAKGRNDDKIGISLEDNPDAIRMSLWRWTDHYYNQARDNYSNVKTNKAVTATERDSSADFSTAEKVEKFYEEPQYPVIDKDVMREKVKKYSAFIKKSPAVLNSGVDFSVITEDRRYVNTEGARIRTSNTFIRLSYWMANRLKDGMDIERNGYYDCDTISCLPSDEKVFSDMEKSQKELEMLSQSKEAEPYSGPAILRGRASGVFFHEIFGHRMEGHRQKEEKSGQTFTGKIGHKIISSMVNVYEDPTMKYFNGTFLRGYYKYDNEGISARRVQLIDKGILKTFLMARSPIEGVPNSNGHGRRSPGYDIIPRMGNLIVEPVRPVSYSELRRQLIAEIKKRKKPYGLIFDDISGGFTLTERGAAQIFKVNPLVVYKVFADGRPDEMIRGADMVGTPIASFERITAVSNDYEIFNGSCGAESGWVPVSAVSPSILVSDIEIEKVAKSQYQPPILPAP